MPLLAESDAATKYGQNLRTAALQDRLSRHQFQALFIEELGWDFASGTIGVEVDGQEYGFEILAQKRGFQILHCTTGRQALFNRRRLRTIQKALSRSIHEHLAIYSSDVPRKQVWQWAYRDTTNQRLRHSEHPFFSHDVPTPLLERLRRLEFSLEEEANITVIDAIDRIRIALSPPADRELFVRRPAYAERSDHLAVKVKYGEPGALQAFVEYHLPLARHLARTVYLHFEVPEEDAIQIASIGLIRAAEKFDPDLGYQFSTYATNWIERALKRGGPYFSLMIHVPQYAFWKCLRLRRRRKRLRREHPPTTARQLFEDVLGVGTKRQLLWQGFRAATTVRAIEGSTEIQENIRRVESTVTGPLAQLAASEQVEQVQRILLRLAEREQDVIRARYGIGQAEETLEQVGERLGLTRERVRQIQNAAEEELRRLIGEENQPLFSCGLDQC